MSYIEIVLIGIGLAMDAFAVSICKGLAMKEITMRKVIKIGLYFGIFQAVMPLIGYLLGECFENFVLAIDHWIAFVLLSSIGLNMIFESFSDKKNEENENIGIKIMCILALATSIDALAVRNNICIF